MKAPFVPAALLLVLAACGGQSASGDGPSEDGGAPGDSSTTASDGPLDAVPGSHDVSATAVLAVSRLGTGGGRVTSVPSGIDCGTMCAAPFTTQVVHLAATADPGSDFVGWSGGGCAGKALECDAALAAAGALVRVEATFQRAVGVLNVTRSGAGSGNVGGGSIIDCGATCGATLASGTMLTLKATPVSGSIFSGWSGCPSVAGDECNVTILDAVPVAADAAFAPCPSPIAGGSRYVDHDLGQDDPAFGGQAGTCAYKTLTYALGRATDMIFLARGAYPGAANDDAPYVLHDRQVLVGDVSDASGVVLWSLNQTDGVVFSGTRNGVDHITMTTPPSGGGQVGVSVPTEPASPQDPHFVTNSSFIGLPFATRIRGAVRVEGSTFRSNGYALEWAPASGNGSMNGNTFIANQYDAYCGGSDWPNVIGSGNVRGSGPIVCSGCAHCPFQ